MLFDNTAFAFQESFYDELLPLFGRSVLSFSTKPQIDLNEKVQLIPNSIKIYLFLRLF
jgi:hypothetical protein